MVNKTMKKMMKNTNVFYTLIISLIGLLILLGVLLTNKKQEGFRYFTPRRYRQVPSPKLTFKSPFQPSPKPPFQPSLASRFQLIKRSQKPTFKPSSKRITRQRGSPPRRQLLPSPKLPQPHQMPNKLIRRASVKNIKQELKRLKEQEVPNNELIKIRKNYFKKNKELRPSQINEKKKPEYTSYGSDTPIFI